MKIEDDLLTAIVLFSNDAALASTSTDILGEAEN